MLILIILEKQCPKNKTSSIKFLSKWMLRVRDQTFLFVALSAQDIKNISCKCSPEYQSMLPINQNYEKIEKQIAFGHAFSFKKKS